MLARALLAAVTALIASAALAAPAPAAAPSLRLFAADGRLTVDRVEIESMQLGLWVASVGGEFRVRVRRPDYGAWTGEQVDPATGATLRTIPAELLHGPNGFARFLDVRVVARDGHLAAHRTLSFCPAIPERVNGDGPRTPTYAGYATCSTGFPFAIGAVWGIDQGWASAIMPLFARHRRLRVAPGRYRVLARIRAPFQKLLAIPPDQAQAEVAVRVKRDRHRIRVDLPPVAIGRSSAARRPARAAADATPDPATLPDLVALPPWQLRVRHHRNRDLLGFAGTPWNAGPGPLDLEGFRSPGASVMPAVQYFIGPDGEVTGSAPAGRLQYHAGGGHDHWHLRQFVTYSLLTRSGGEVVSSRKQDFCMAPTDAVDLTVPGAVINPEPFGLDGSSCGDLGSIWLRETLPAGWGDTYSPYVSGQDFDITHVPNGRYLVEMRVNPLGELHEVTTANDTASRTIVLRGRPGHRHVRVGAWHGIRR